MRAHLTKLRIARTNIIILMMKSKLDLKTVVGRVFGKSLRQVMSPGSQWWMFTPYSQANGGTVLLKLVEIPSNYRTSEQMIIKIKQQFKNILHDVDFILVERNFDADVYLLKTEENLISVDSYIQIKREAGQKFDQKTIQNFIQLASALESHPLSHKISFNLDEMAITKQNKFVLANYRLYFQSTLPEQNNLSRDIKYMLARLLMPESGAVNLSLLYSHVEQNYQPGIQAMVEKFMADPDFKVSEVVTSATEHRESVVDTTMTDSFHSENPVEDLTTKTQSGSDLSVNLLTSEAKPSKNKYKTSVFAIVFVIILIVIGAVTFQYLKPRPIICQDSQYLDKDLNQCFGCDASCETCQGNTNETCLSCKETLFLIIKDRTEKVGKCSLSCMGTKVKQNVCIASS